MSEAERHTIIVTQIGGRFGAWEYEIRRDGRPLPARLREVGFKTEHTARLAGKVALQDFLSGLTQEESGHACVDQFTPAAHRSAREARAMRANERATGLAPIVAALQASGVTTLRGIAAALNERGVPTPTGSGQWHPIQVLRLLKRAGGVGSPRASRGRR